MYNFILMGDAFVELFEIDERLGNLTICEIDDVMDVVIFEDI